MSKKFMWLDWSKMTKQFSVNSHRYFSAFQVVIVEYSALFILGKCLMDSQQVLLIFTEVWPKYFSAANKFYSSASQHEQKN